MHLEIRCRGKILQFMVLEGRILIANATGVNLFEILLIEFVRC